MREKIAFHPVALSLGNKENDLVGDAASIWRYAEVRSIHARLPLQFVKHTLFQLLVVGDRFLLDCRARRCTPQLRRWPRQ